MTFEGNTVTALVRITVQPGKTFRGVLHFTERSYDVSPSLAAHAVSCGKAILAAKQEA